jgi:hypothetical protein
MTRSVISVPCPSKKARREGSQLSWRLDRVALRSSSEPRRTEVQRPGRHSVSLTVGLVCWISDTLEWLNRPFLKGK